MAEDMPNAQALIEGLQGSISSRKLRLFACGRCRRYWTLLTDERSREAVETAERWADGLASEEERRSAFLAADAAATSEAFEDADDETVYLQSVAAAYACHSLWDDAYIAAHATAPPLIIPDLSEEAEAVAQLHDLVGQGNPPGAHVPAIYPPELLRLAQAIYDERAFERMPELAYALTTSGCTNSEMLAHCRDGRNHWRGCWVIDAILGRW
jgi:hypothetical protein